MQLNPVIASAKTAMALSGEPLPQGNLDGHTVVHWSHYVLLATGIFGAVATVAAAIISQWPLAIAAGVMAGSSLLGAYEIKQLSIGIGLEDIISGLVNTIHKLYAQTQDLTKDIAKDKQNEGQLKKLTDDYNKAIKASQDREQQNLIKMKELADQLAARDAKIAQQQKVFDQAKADNDKFAAMAGDLFKTLDGIQQGASALNSAGANVETKLDQDAGEIKTNADAITSGNKIFETYIAKLRTLVNAFANVVKQSQTQQKQIDELSDTVNTLKQSLGNYQEGLGPMLKELEEKFPPELLAKLNERLANVK